MEDKMFLEMDDSENKMKDVRPLTKEDDLFLLQIAKKHRHTFEEGSALDVVNKEQPN